MSQPAEQITIFDFDLGVEHIPGAVSAAQRDVDAARKALYDELVDASDGEICCIPDQKIHIFGDDGDRCICQRRRKDKKTT